jgi:hypothetical protein
MRIGADGCSLFEVATHLINHLLEPLLLFICIVDLKAAAISPDDKVSVGRLLALKLFYQTHVNEELSNITVPYLSS